MRARAIRKPSLHTVRKWLSGPDAGAERDTNSGRLHQSAVAMAAAVYLAGGVAHGQQGPNISLTWATTTAAANQPGLRRVALRF